MGRQRTWTDDDLRAAVAKATSWRQVSTLLGLSHGGQSYKAIQATAERLELDCRHFRGQGWSKGTGQGRDREAARAGKQRWYESHRAVYTERNARKRRERVLAVRELKDGPCQDCGKSFPYVAMDFDHRPDEIKLFSIANGTRSMVSLPKLLAEIAKCDLVCAVCHRLRTADRAGWDDAIMFTNDE